ncbi:hypothetical protein CHS0354_001738 [Potamilus streckersoni]|uniref:Tetratricopeptide repeat protein 23-like n=1 Tax=Potamilus streckersoni TaxID=2493646 RepID=A0AAE0T329_9BIVA|nr:hypothetical protein CHS0354_001738 [Potamilus streckersoni]
MSEEESDIETQGVMEPIVVDVKRIRGHRSSLHLPRQERHAENNEDSDEEISEELEEDEEDMGEGIDVQGPSSQRSPSRSSSRRHIKTKNGKRAVNMTPPDRLLRIAEKKAGRYAEKGKVDKSVQERIRCLALTRIVYGSFHWKMAQSHVNLAEAYLELKGFAVQAEYHTQNAMDIMLSSVHTTSTETEKAEVFRVLFQLNYTLGKAQTMMKKYADADTAFLKADRAYQALAKLLCVTDDECEELEMQLTHVMARLSWRQKKHAVSASQLDKVLELASRRYGEDSVQLIPIFQECGRLEQSKGRHANHEKVIEMFLQAHSIAGANYKDSMELVDTALALAQAYSCTGKEEAESSAEKYLNECLATCTTVHGPEHTKTLDVQDELARLFVRTGREEDALGMLRSSIGPKAEVYGDYSEVVSDTYKLIASIYLAQGNIEKSLRTYKKCLNIETHVLGKNHRKTKDTERTIDILIASPSVSSKFVLNNEDELKKRPRFSAVVNRSKPLGGFKPQ